MQEVSALEQYIELRFWKLLHEDSHGSEFNEELDKAFTDFMVDYTAEERNRAIWDYLHV